MTVEELIEELKKASPNTIVYLPWGEQNFYPEDRMLKTVRIKSDNTVELDDV